MSVDFNRYVRTRDLARMLGCAPSTITRRAARGELATIVDPRDHRQRLVDRRVVEAMFAPLQRNEDAA